MNLGDRRIYYILYGFIVLVVIVGLFIPVMEVDAAQYASISKQMLETGNFLELFNRDLNYLDKPPLLFWLSSLSLYIFGISDVAYKLPSVLFSLVGVISVFRLARLYYSKTAAHTAALIFASCVAFFLVNHDIRTDTLLISLVAFSVYHLAAYREKPGRYHFIWGFVGIGLAMLAKGPIALLIVIWALGTDAVLKRQWKFIFNPKWLAGLLIVVAVLAPMCYGLYTQYDANPEVQVNNEQGVSGLKFYFWTQSFGRITGDSVWATAYSNNPGPFFLTTTFLWAFLPWTFLFLAGFFTKIKELWQQRLKISTGEFIGFGGFLLPLMALSTSGFQLNHYVYVVIPFAALVAAKAAEDLLLQQGRMLRIFNGLQLFLVIMVFVLAVLLLTFVFPQMNLFWLALMIVFVLISVFAFTRGRSRARLLFIPAFMFIGVHLLMEAHFYQRLLPFQTAKLIHRDIGELQIPEENVYTFNIGASHALDFYSKHWIPEVRSYTLDSIVDRYHAIYVVTDAQGLDILREGDCSLTYLKEYHYYEVTLLTVDFLLYRRREEVAKRRYLVCIRPGPEKLW